MVGLTMTEKVLQLGALAKSLLGSGLVLDPLNPPTETVTPPTHRVLLFPINLSLKFPFPPSRFQLAWAASASSLPLPSTQRISYFLSSASLHLTSAALFGSGYTWYWCLQCPGVSISTEATPSPMDSLQGLQPSPMMPSFSFSL